MAATKVCDLTGPGITDRFGVGGTDLGIVRKAPDGRLVAVFGDTFEQPGVGGPGWRTPIALFANPFNISEGLRWTDSAGPGQYAAQLVPAPHGRTLRGVFVSTQLPTDMVVVDNVMYLHVMACEGLGNVHYTEIYASYDNGDTWQTTNTWWPGYQWAGLFQMCTFENGNDGWIYCLSTGFQRDKGLILLRVPVANFANRMMWQAWGWTLATGWQWGNSPTIVLPGQFGELCLRKIGNEWLLVAFDAANYRIDLRRISSPTDDLAEEPVTTLAYGCNWNEENHALGRVAQLYGGYIIPGSTSSSLSLVISQWNTETNWPYHSMQFYHGSNQQQFLLN